MEVPKPIIAGNLQLCPKRKAKGENVDSLTLLLGLVDYGDGNDTRVKEVKAAFRFSILNRDGQPVVQTAMSTDCLVHIFRKSVLKGFDRLITPVELIAPEKQLVVNDSLKILCQVWIDRQLIQKLGTPAPNCALSDEERSRLWKDRLANDIEKMYKQSIGTDVTVYVGQGQSKSTFKAHKAILTARSSVFAAMFNNVKMLEGKTASVTISDFDQEVVKGMLEYLYTGNADCMAKRAPELLEIAEKYHLEGLKEHCECVISKSLNNDNVVTILTLADKFNASFLKSRAVDFININKRELSQLKSFKAAVKSASGIFAELFMAQP